MHLESLKSSRAGSNENEDFLLRGIETISLSSHSDDENFDRYTSIAATPLNDASHILTTPTWNTTHTRLSPERYSSGLPSLNSYRSNGDWGDWGDWGESTHVTPVDQAHKGDFPASYVHAYEGDADDSTYHTEESRPTFVQLAFNTAGCPSSIHRTVCLSSAHDNCGTL